MYEESMVSVLKGSEQPLLVRMLTTFTTIDMAENKFSGKIPDSIGNLNSLKCLNLSHNNLTGQIPSSIGNVKALESLDLTEEDMDLPHEEKEKLHALKRSSSWKAMDGKW
ncbi:hypothetical protein SASPL_156547 [Salvia splendens]|uniref:Uncharacterized protein n=1 Tax=Salvia splendens TaxID=180675 RepID=A0A8X8VWG1_SALSN|nr:hypothetical protein SASPL_156547 [Salvia splendens]